LELGHILYSERDYEQAKQSYSAALAGLLLSLFYHV
jgi:hypothetical protein